MGRVCPLRKVRFIMKKILSLSLAALLCLGLLAGCGGDKGSDTPPPPEGGEPATSMDPAAAAKLSILETEYITEDYAICMKKDSPLLADINKALADLKADGSLDAIIAKYIEGTPHDLKLQEAVPADAPTLTMGTNAAFPPYEFYEAEQIVGIDAEVAAAIADKLGRKLVISDMEFETIIVAVQTGKADIGVAGMTVTDERKQNVDFSDSYATGKQVVIVKEGSSITSIDDLFAEGAHHKIGVQQNTTGDLYSTADIEEKGLGEIKRFNKGTDAVQALLVDQIDCVIIDNEPAKAFVAANS